MQRGRGEVESLASWSPSHLTSSLSLEVKCSTTNAGYRAPEDWSNVVVRDCAKSSFY